MRGSVRAERPGFNRGGQRFGSVILHQQAVKRGRFFIKKKSLRQRPTGGGASGSRPGCRQNAVPLGSLRRCGRSHRGKRLTEGHTLRERSLTRLGRIKSKVEATRGKQLWVEKTGPEQSGRGGGNARDGSTLRAHGGCLGYRRRRRTW